MFRAGFLFSQLRPQSTAHLLVVETPFNLLWAV